MSDCLIQSLSTLLDEDLSELSYTHIEEIRNLLWERDMDFIWIERRPDCFEGEERFFNYIQNKKAILLIDSGVPHAMAWDGEGWIDPRGYVGRGYIPKEVDYALVLCEL